MLTFPLLTFYYNYPNKNTSARLLDGKYLLRNINIERYAAKSDVVLPLSVVILYSSLFFLEIFTAMGCMGGRREDLLRQENFANTA